MNPASKIPSFWSGVAASRYYFQDTADYSSWACGLLESGRDSDSIRVLAGLFDEDNLFELREWHRRVLRDLGFADLDARGAFLAHIRGYAEEFLAGARVFTDINQQFHELRMETGDQLLEPFDMLHYGFWDFDTLNLSDLGVSTIADLQPATTKACHALLSEIQAEQDAAPQIRPRW